jgi:hypothetical protein
MMFMNVNWRSSVPVNPRKASVANAAVAARHASSLPAAPAASAVHEPPCVERRQDVGQCRQQREQDDGHDAPRLFAPMSNGETENVLERTSAEVDFFCVSHLPQPVARRATRLSGQEKMRATAGARLHVRAN